MFAKLALPSRSLQSREGAFFLLAISFMKLYLTAQGGL